MKSSFEERLNQILPRLASSDVLDNRGAGGEIGFWIFDYADAVKATVDNLATLCLDRVDADKLALKRQIQESLARLERQNLVSRNGDLVAESKAITGGSDD